MPAKLTANDTNGIQVTLKRGGHSPYNSQFSALNSQFNPYLQTVISVANLSYAFNDAVALRFPDFEVVQGDHLLLTGQSGSGKTTLLHLIGGLRRNYKGSIRIDNTELSSLTSSTIDRFRGGRIGFVFQRNHLIPALTVEDNLRMAPYLAGIPIDDARVDQLLNRLDLTHQRQKRVHQLSQGQAQRVAIARAVLNRPAIVVADEPTSSLDDNNCRRVIDLLLQVAGENSSSLLVATHDRRLMDRMKKQIILS
ncbi:ATP-binding cassette domain-containing protein [Chryseolinea sp. T2]|uniref:ABC transporter ATP-binding protein n=1 Tax=Chryseolinea sp. T2 TaxID=3129255 RepID=UPI0030787C3F